MVAGLATAQPAARREWQALGTTAVVATADEQAIATASALLEEELAALDRACSRFREDSEVVALARAGGEPVQVSALCAAAIGRALAVAEWTGGAVDPTVGAALVALGYDRDFGSVAPAGPALERLPGPVPGWWSVALDRATGTVSVPTGTLLDLGSSAKAWCADRCAARIAEVTGSGVLVSLGGDIAVAGPAPAGGWAVGIAARCSEAPEVASSTVSITSGGLASSGVAVRHWRRGGAELHHVLEPWTGRPAPACWRLVSVAGPTCLEANAASTAALVWGPEAPDRLAGLGLPARLVGQDGQVLACNGWPPPTAAEGEA